MDRTIRIIQKTDPNTPAGALPHASRSHFPLHPRQAALTLCLVGDKNHAILFSLLNGAVGACLRAGGAGTMVAQPWHIEEIGVGILSAGHILVPIRTPS